jgi:uncharacterized protein
MKLVKAKKDIVLTSRHGNRPFLVDAAFYIDGKPKPVVLFVHGFKGFKDWGYFNVMARYFVEKGFVFIKLNLSRNGTTPEQPLDFADLDAFAENNFSIELDDIGVVLDTLHASDFVHAEEVDLNRVYLMGHSRGGGLALLKAAEDSRVKKVVTLAAVSDLNLRWDEAFVRQWKEEGVQYVANSRTGQDMPLNYQLWEDLQQNRDRLNILNAVAKLQIPLLFIHGTFDETLPVEMAQQLQEAQPDGELFLIEGANHVFGGQHPYEDEALPAHALMAVHRAIDFLTE